MFQADDSDALRAPVAWQKGGVGLVTENDNLPADAVSAVSRCAPKDKVAVLNRAAGTQFLPGVEAECSIELSWQIAVHIHSGHSTVPSAEEIPFSIKLIIDCQLTTL